MELHSLKTHQVLKSWFKDILPPNRQRCRRDFLLIYDVRQHKAETRTPFPNLLLHFQGRQGSKGDRGDPGQPGVQVSKLPSHFVAYEQETRVDPWRAALLLSVHSARLKPHLEWEVGHAILRETHTLSSAQ